VIKVIYPIRAFGGDFVSMRATTMLIGQVENKGTKLANQMSMQITSYCSYLLESTAGAACPGGSLRHRIIQWRLVPLELWKGGTEWPQDSLRSNSIEDGSWC
jgi:hypothetical protein